MIRLTNISLRRGTHLLFQDVSLDLHPGEKVGLVGANGSGKSSLILLLMGQIHSDSGDLYLPSDTRISHVAQETPSSQSSALDYVLDGDTEYRALQNKLKNQSQQDDSEISQIYSRLDEIDGYAAPSRAAKILSGLGFQNQDIDRPTSSFSGGWRVRLNLAQALMTPSDLLLLDEPTNHLDLDAIVWLEGWLKKYQGTIVVISHDRDFIDGCSKKILHIENQRIRGYTGNYSEFERARADRIETEQKVYEKQVKKIAHMESFVRRFKYKASKAKQAQSRIKALEKIQLTAPAHLDSPFSFSFKPCERLSDPILQLEDISAGYEDNTVLSDVSVDIARGDRIGLLGVNGAGKSTLIKILAERLEPFSGSRISGKHLNVGYFAQHQMEQLDERLSPMQLMQASFPTATTQEIRNYLGGYNFRGEKVDESVSVFSGGEKARLVLAKLIYSEPNLLLLDEPTNHLDMEMRHALNLAIQEFQGAIVLVSHDRNLLNSVADQLFLIDQGTLTEFNDDLETYLKILRQNQARREQQIDSSDDNSALSEKPENVSKKQRRQLQAQKRQMLKPARDKVRGLEKDMDQIRVKIADLETILENPETYETESTANLSKMMQTRSELMSQMEDIETAWLDAAENLEVMEAEAKSD